MSKVSFLLLHVSFWQLQSFRHSTHTSVIWFVVTQLDLTQLVLIMFSPTTSDHYNDDSLENNFVYIFHEQYVAVLSTTTLRVHPAQGVYYSGCLATHPYDRAHSTLLDICLFGIGFVRDTKWLQHWGCVSVH